MTVPAYLAAALRPGRVGGVVTIPGGLAKTIGWRGTRRPDADALGSSPTRDQPALPGRNGATAGVCALARDRTRELLTNSVTEREIISGALLIAMGLSYPARRSGRPDRHDWRPCPMPRIIMAIIRVHATRPSRSAGVMFTVRLLAGRRAGSEVYCPGSCHLPCRLCATGRRISLLRTDVTSVARGGRTSLGDAVADARCAAGAVPAGSRTGHRSCPLNQPHRSTTGPRCHRAGCAGTADRRLTPRLPGD